MDNLESVMRRVAKLLAIATDDRANANEAASAAGQAERIMRKYQIDHADVILTQLKNTDAMEEVSCMASAKTNGTKVKVVPPWAGILAMTIGRLNDCHVRVVTIDGNAMVRFSGFGIDVKLCEWMFHYLVNTSLRLCKEFKNTEEYKVIGRRAVDSYRSGVTTGINASLRALLKEKVAEATTTGTSLVVAKMHAVEAKYGTQQSRPAHLVGDKRANAFASGYLAGREVNVSSRAVGVTSSALLLGSR